MSGNNGTIRPVGKIYANYKGRMFLPLNLANRARGSHRKY